MSSQDPATRSELTSAPDTDAPSATMLAIQNALKLGGSLILTWGIALGMRLLLPRFLGPHRFGTLNFADGFTTTMFIALNLGVESYIRKEVAVRPAHASDFFGGSFTLRVLMTAGVFAAIALVAKKTGMTPEVQKVVYLYGATQFFVIANATLSAILHAKGRVGAMSVLAVATKVVWAAGVLAAMAMDAGLWAYATSYLASEAVETVVLYWLAQVHLGLKFRMDWRATKAMLLASLPYYLNVFATTAYGKLDISLLEFKANTNEVGWYGSATAISSLTLLITPLIGWVLMPMFARAAARSREELYQDIRRSMELILTVAIPASMMINLGADFWVHLVFGDAFMPAVMALRIQATMFVLTYVAIVYAISLVMLERPWILTSISILGLVVNVALNLVLIPRCATFGPGGSGAGSAFAMLGTEIFVTASMVGMVGLAGFDRRSVSAIAKSLAIYGAIALIHPWLAPLGDLLRLVVDGLLYLALASATGALRLREMYTVGREALRKRG
jgi:O-antigen/teichoic acid export membrane protein